MKASSGSVVGVRELKARISAYLRAVARGATVTIGDRRRHPIARLVPVVRQEYAEVLDRLAAQGVLQVGRGAKPGARQRVRLKGKGPLASGMVIEDRR